MRARLVSIRYTIGYRSVSAMPTDNSCSALCSRYTIGYRSVSFLRLSVISSQLSVISFNRTVILSPGVPPVSIT